MVIARSTVGQVCQFVSATESISLPSRYNRVVSPSGPEPRLACFILGANRCGDNRQCCTQLRVYRLVPSLLAAESDVIAVVDNGFSKISTAFFPYSTRNSEIEETLRAQASGLLNTKPFLTHTYGPDQVEKAFSLLSDTPDDMVNICIDWIGS